ncbi:MAG: hypothetical protein AAGK35_14630, partial [Pseudomonadota bacterium]
EGMGRNFAAHDIYERFYSPSDVDDLCPQIFEHAITALSADASVSWGLGTIPASVLEGAVLPWIPATQSSWARRCAGVDGYEVHLEPG